MQRISAQTAFPLANLKWPLLYKGTSEGLVSNFIMPVSIVFWRHGVITSSNAGHAFRMRSFQLSVRPKESILAGPTFSKVFAAASTMLKSERVVALMNGIWLNHVQL